MPEHLQKLLRLTLPLLFCCTMPVMADDERWYRVELMVFSQGDGQTGELFEPAPTLSYPNAFRFLVYPQQLAQQQQQHQQPSRFQQAQNESSELTTEHTVELDEFGRTLLHIKALEVPDIEVRETAWPMTQAQQQPDALLDTELEQTTANDEDLPAPRPTPFIALPDSIRELNTAASTLSRTGRYTVLFHQSWNQPVAAKADALPIVLDYSGDSNEWPELQGSVLLHLSRFLHLETNLWRNTDGRYLHRQWRMQPAPLGPPSVIIEQAELPENLNLEVVTEIAPALEDIDMLTIPDATVGESLSLEPVYPYRHAVRMQQSRRMRSNEVHYIDHPMLGLVIKITPLTEEDLQIQTEQELTQWPHVQKALPQTLN